MEIELIQGMLSSGADGATIVIGVVLLKLERRLHNLEIFTGLKKLIPEK
jgi:hypothetical protein